MEFPRDPRIPRNVGGEVGWSLEQPGRATESMECGTIPAGNLPAERFFFSSLGFFPGVQFFKDFLTFLEILGMGKSREKKLQVRPDGAEQFPGILFPPGSQFPNFHAEFLEKCKKAEFGSFSIQENSWRRKKIKKPKLSQASRAKNDPKKKIKISRK